MKPGTRKIIIVSVFSLLSIIALLLIFWPKILLYYLTEVRKVKYLDVKPGIITQINTQNIASTRHDIGLVKADLKLTEVKKIDSRENLLSIEYDNYYILILGWEPAGQAGLNFSKHYEILNTTTEDLKVLNKPGLNINLLINLLAKAAIILSGNVEVLSADEFNVISQLFTGKEEKAIRMSIYDSDNKYVQEIILGPKNNSVDLQKKYIEFINSLSPSMVVGYTGEFNNLAKLLLLQFNKTYP